MKTVLVTNVQEYAGPGVIEVLVREGYKLLCHDAGFTEPDARAAFEGNTGGKALVSQEPDAIFAEVSAIDEVDRFVFNDVLHYTPRPIEEIEKDVLQSAFEALLAFPFRLSQLFLPGLKVRERGAMVFITSARQLQPEPGFAVATSIRAGTTAFAMALAREAAPHGIQVNCVQPNYLYSEMYYPKARFMDNPAGRAVVAEKVPLGRLGEPREIGELVEFFVSGHSPFTTGQVINFTGGWP